MSSGGRVNGIIRYMEIKKIFNEKIALDTKYTPQKTPRHLGDN